jgi:hypothetical protein
MSFVMLTIASRRMFFGNSRKTICQQSKAFAGRS